jgi:hypothetical protein
MNSDSPTETNTLVATKDESKEQAEAWECAICCGDGSKTGRLRLACSHETCLGCFVKMTVTPTYYGSAPTELKCPFCRGAIRTTEGLTEQEKTRVRVAVSRVESYTRQIKRAEESLTALKAEQTNYKQQLATVQRDLKVSDEDVKAIVAELPVPRDQPQAVAQPTPVAATPLANVPRQALAASPPGAANPTLKCPGCRSWRPANLVRFRHVHDEDGTTRRLRRCDTCQDDARRNYENAARARLAALTATRAAT